MFLFRWIHRLWSLLFPAYEKKLRSKEEVEIRRLGQVLFSEQRMRSIYPHLKVRRSNETGKWTVSSASELEPYLFFNTLPAVGKTSVRHTAKRILTSVPIGHDRYLVLIEYLYPSWSRWNLSGEEEFLFAHATIRSGLQTFDIMDFYKK